MMSPFNKAIAEQGCSYQKDVSMFSYRVKYNDCISTVRRRIFWATNDIPSVNSKEYNEV